MKKVFRQFSLILPLVVLLQSSLQAQDDDDKDHEKDRKETKYEFEKTKSVNKSYNVSSSEKLDIQNKFGDVNVQVWTKMEIKVDVQIKVTAKTDAWAKSVLDDIIVEDTKSGNTIKFKTLFAEDRDDRDKRREKYEGKNTRQTMEVNYTVYMPASNPLEIDNQFGETTLPDFKGEVDLTSKFGKLTTGNLSNVKEIDVEFGKATLGNIPGGKIGIKYSKASIARLSGKIKMDIEFSSSIVLNLDNSLDALDIHASYSTLNLKPMGDIPASYNVYTNFGSFKNKTSIKFTSDEDDDEHGIKFDHEYTGKSGSGNVPVKIKSDFSTIILGDASEDEMKGKDKDKNKRKKAVSI